MPNVTIPESKKLIESLDNIQLSSKLITKQPEIKREGRVIISCEVNFNIRDRIDELAYHHRRKTGLKLVMKDFYVEIFNEALKRRGF